MLRKSVSSALFAAAVIAGPASVCLAGSSAGPVIIRAGVHDVSPPLRSIKNAPPGIRHEEEQREILPGMFRHVSGRPDPLLPPGGGFRAPAQLSAVPTTPVTFEGEGAGLAGFLNVSGPNYIPPDSNGDVGPNHYVQWLNGKYAVFSKTGTVLMGPTNGNSLWTGFPTTDGNSCGVNNDGDPIVQYDQLADRWVLTQFDVPDNGANYQCVAISTTGDPTGSYYRYDFKFLTYFNDYPKLGVWPDAYYMTWNFFDDSQPHDPFVGGEACALDRINMLAGQDATAQCFGPDLDLGGGLPIDFDGSVANLPPTGEAATFANYGSDPNNGNVDALLTWKFHVDWTTPANTTFTGPTYLDVASFTAACPSINGNDSCIPQQAVSQKLDALSDRIMYRLPYRNIGGTESILLTHSVQPGVGTAVSGIRWYELRLDGSGNPSVYQQGTFAPNDGLSRWLPSIAMDAAGNIAVGYSTSSSSTRPSIKIASRAATDPLGSLGNETVFYTGTASQTGINRWGDYSAMTIDPSDGCTFWYTNEYYIPPNSEDWQSKIGSFRLPNSGPSISGPSVVCLNDPLTLSAAAGFDSYQWSLAGNPIAGATGPTYSVAAASPADAGGYKVVGVKNGCTSLVSSTFSVTVDSPTAPAITGSTVACLGSQLQLSATAGARSYQWSLGGNPISGATLATYTVASAGPGDAGNYTVTSTDANSCVSPVSPAFHVTVDTPPAAPTISGATLVCNGHQLQLSATAGATSYQWSLGGNPISGATLSTYTVASAGPGNAGNYTVTASDASSCKSAPSSVFNVTVDSPAAPAITGASIVCLGTQLQLSATAGASSYQWSLGGNPILGATAATYTVSSAGPGDGGNYTVTSTDANSCMSPASSIFHVTVDSPAAPAITGPTLVCVGTQLQLSATAGATSYQWSLDSGSGPSPISGATLATYTVASAGPGDGGIYTVTAMDANSCTSPASTAFPVSIGACAVMPHALTVDATPNGGLSDGNGIFEPGETVIVDPNWMNNSGAGDAVTGAASAFTGPAGPTYTIPDGTADYGSIPASGTADCTSATSNCFAFKVTAPATRPTIHWDSTFVETPSDGSAAKTWTLHLGDSFSDVPRSDGFYPFIEAIIHHNVTLGCGNGTAGKGLFCETATTTREQMAAFIARAILNGDANVPVSGAGYNCEQVAIGQTVPPGPYTSLLADVNPVSDSFCRHINYLYVNGISSGCDMVPDFCENALLNRGQMSAFIARAILNGDANVPVSGAGYNCMSGGSSNFTDVPPTDPFCRHINYLFVHGIVAGFGGGIFGENDPVTRGQSAKFLAIGFGLKIYGP